MLRKTTLTLLILLLTVAGVFAYIQNQENSPSQSSAETEAELTPVPEETGVPPPPDADEFPWPFWIPESVFGNDPFDPEARDRVDWGFPADFYVECATWENEGLTWLYLEDDEKWGAYVKQPCYRFCGIPEPYPEKPVPESESTQPP
ncbi:MAG: hypothetical protein OXF22_05150 [Anaerolineaceae bacterium]|nr:hypothetical protein [Anaerolineaceae bacterium]